MSGVLSARDQNILEYILGRNGISNLENNSTREDLKPSHAEIEAVKLAEAGDYDAALACIEKVIATNPTPSPLNNK